METKKGDLLASVRKLGSGKLRGPQGLWIQNLIQPGRSVWPLHCSAWLYFLRLFQRRWDHDLRQLRAYILLALR